jgi:citrate synthase
MSDTKQPSATTAICGYDADSISIRGQDLVGDLIGKRTFTEALLLQALGSEPSPTQVKIVDGVLVTIMEHGLVPSAIVTRMTHYGAPESFQGAIAAGLLGVGDRYAGTASECGAILERIARADDQKAQAEAEVADYRARRRPVPGFGHPIHRGLDPRVERLLEVTREAGAEGQYLAAMQTLETTLNEVLKKGLVTNISAAIGAALAEAGVPSGMMRGIVLTARCAGLVGHLFEEMNNPASPAMWDAAQDAVSYEP